MVRSAESLVVRSSVLVPLAVPDAFRLFTERIHEWWPLDTHSVYGERARGVVIEPRADGSIIETSEAGETAEWGTVTAWQPPDRLSFTWHPGEDGRVVTQVEISFTAAADGGTVVDLLHTGWEAKGDRAADLVSSYGPGWEHVLGRYQAAAGTAG